MNHSLKKITLLSVLFLSAWAMNSCKKDVALSGIDEELYEMARNTTNFTLFKNSTDLLDMSAGSGHSQPYLRTRYNTVAATQLNSDARIIENAVFPEGSLIVKDLYSNSTTLDRYAILYKKSNDPNADARGWVWGYLESNGKVVESAVNKGSACISCHSQSENIDYMLMNKYFE